MSRALDPALPTRDLTLVYPTNKPGGACSQERGQAAGRRARNQGRRWKGDRRGGRRFQGMMYTVVMLNDSLYNDIEHSRVHYVQQVVLIRTTVV